MLKFTQTIGQNYVKIGFGLFSSCGIFLAYRRTQPFPAVYLQSSDSKSVVKFSNVGLGPMYLFSINILLDGKMVANENLKEVLSVSSPQVKLSSFSRCFLKPFSDYRQFAHNSTINLITYFPTSNNNEWNDALIRELKDKKLSVRVVYGWSNKKWLRMKKDFPVG